MPHKHGPSLNAPDSTNESSLVSINIAHPTVAYDMASPSCHTNPREVIPSPDSFQDNNPSHFPNVAVPINNIEFSDLTDEPFLPLSIGPSSETFPHFLPGPSDSTDSSFFTGAPSLVAPLRVPEPSFSAGTSFHLPPFSLSTDSANPEGLQAADHITRANLRSISELPCATENHSASQQELWVQEPKSRVKLEKPSLSGQTIGSRKLHKIHKEFSVPEGYLEGRTQQTKTSHRKSLTWLDRRHEMTHNRVRKLWNSWSLETRQSFQVDLEMLFAECQAIEKQTRQKP